MSLSILSEPSSAFLATSVGSLIGELYNIVTRGGPPIFIVGIVWARAPEALIIGWARRKGWRIIVISMIIATIYETFAFLIPDWLFYTYGIFGYGNPMAFNAGFFAALPDLFTLIDLIYIPIAIAIIKATKTRIGKLGVLLENSES
jgi:hypothetical protein